jgi:MoaA/NifB/PqqE/SkfB family radical SAM enzyme
MKQHYSIRDYLHFARMFQRNHIRQKIWGKHFEEALHSKSYRIPQPAVFQVIPTEACNLRCPMCNQWGEKGYFLEGLRQVEHMDKNRLTDLMRSASPRDSLITIHGGEPFVYKYTDLLLELLLEKPFDVMFATNGTLLKRYLEPLKEIKNLSFLLSVDGDRETHDKIRGKGCFDQIKEGLTALFEARRRSGMPLPLVIMNIIVCEWTTRILEKVFKVARQLGVFVINYNMRWFFTEKIGEAYENHLQKYFSIQSTGAWRGFVSEINEHDYKTAALALRKIKKRKRFCVFPPYVTTMPAKLKGNDFETYFFNDKEVFGNDSCLMPFYWARIHSNGDLIYCPGHPDIIAGNVFKDGFDGAFNSRMSIQFRKHMLHNRFPICNRCCGLYMTFQGRPQEQRVRRKLRIDKKVTAHFP